MKFSPPSPPSRTRTTERSAFSRYSSKRDRATEPERKNRGAARSFIILLHRRPIVIHYPSEQGQKGKKGKEKKGAKHWKRISFPLRPGVNALPRRPSTSRSRRGRYVRPGCCSVRCNLPRGYKDECARIETRSSEKLRDWAVGKGV